MNPLIKTPTLETTARLEMLLCQGWSDVEVCVELNLSLVALAAMKRQMYQRVADSVPTRQEAQTLAVRRLELTLQAAWGEYQRLVGSTSDGLVDNFNLVDGVMVHVNQKLTKTENTQAIKWLVVVNQLNKELRDLQGITPAEHKIVEVVGNSASKELLSKLSAL